MASATRVTYSAYQDCGVKVDRMEEHAKGLDVKDYAVVIEARGHEAASWRRLASHLHTSSESTSHERRVYLQNLERYSFVM